MDRFIRSSADIMPPAARQLTLSMRPVLPRSLCGQHPGTQVQAADRASAPLCCIAWREPLEGRAQMLQGGAHPPLSDRSSIAPSPREKGSGAGARCRAPPASAGLSTISSSTTCRQQVPYLGLCLLAAPGLPHTHWLLPEPEATTVHMSLLLALCLSCRSVQGVVCKATAADADSLQLLQVPDLTQPQNS
jgi:hypothetical protein